ncbi:hypothetical protein, partial [Acinetobacter baumannii]|uniref:hypothetical protein n=1 Tax=Acinetobacter baumannii TaxID=470 RepID=UPI001C46BE46
LVYLYLLSSFDGFFFLTVEHLCNMQERESADLTVINETVQENIKNLRLQLRIFFVDIYGTG